MYNSTSLTAINSSSYNYSLANGEFTLIANGSAWAGLGAGEGVWIYYTYKDYESNTKRALVDVIDATDDISSTWLSLIVTVIMLSIILTLVLRSFLMRGAR